MIQGHGCNAYCAGDLHGDLVYSEGHPDERLLRYSIARRYADRHGVEVGRVEDAREAPDLAAIPAERRVRVSGEGRPESGERQWLVFWRAAEAQA